MQWISVIICTNCKRVEKLSACIASIQKSLYRNFDLLILKQTEKKVNFPFLSGLNSMYVKLNGVSYAKNLGIKKTRGEIMVFTDDDCIVTKDWLANIVKSFNKNNEIAGLFGKVLPYQQKLHPGEICPSTFLENREKLIIKPSYHVEDIGFGNNMAYRKSVFKKLGGFKEWLGPGSIGRAAEDAEMALRVLISGSKILYNPKVKVFHNRWLTPEQSKSQELIYKYAEVACYSYFFFRNQDFSKKVLLDNFGNSFSELKESVKKILFVRNDAFSSIYDALKKLIYRLKGFFVGFYFAKLEKFFAIQPRL